MRKIKKICPLCGGRVSSGKTTFTVDLDFSIIVIRNVPGKICSVCGEEWIENKIAQKLEKLIETARIEKRECEILQYSHLA